MESVLSIVFCLTLLYLAVTRRLESYVQMLALQGMLLTAINILPLFGEFKPSYLLLPAILLVVKAFFIPMYLNKLIVESDLKRTIETTVQNFTFLLIMLAAMAVVFVTSRILSESMPVDTIVFASGFSSVICGLLIIMFRKKLIVHAIGFLILENGIFLFGAAVHFELPFLVEIASLLDIFIVVFIMGVALNKISSAAPETETAELTRLGD
ncbi:MAG: hypothetical protein CVV21_00545 [Candidatus Goldiibacteriota bacterium HGW-Goldbacteria-1]|jgi:hydrogenase-4 component E|nr:MAG: hypothetical protein CVV21_00545 [Candidatus Goldiibacteriota bacterium HGW-Goldbacteria-1]